MQKEYDVVIVGGGIQGCGVAQATAAAGFRTLLLEQNSWGSATSSHSSKLIHGGLRYLQTAQFALVRECLEERDWMLDNLPQIVQPNWFYFPVYRSSSFRPWKLFWGLSIYQALSGYSRYSRFRRLPRSQWKELAGLNTDGLEAVFTYQDAQTDDLLLTRRVQQSAVRLGAECLEQARLTRAARFSEGFQLCYRHNNEEACVKSRMIINASGPWVNHTLACFTPAMEPVAIDLVQGTHVVINERISDRCFTLQAPADLRVVFVLPWKEKTLIGTTETLFEGNPGECRPQQQEIDYLLDTVRHYFPQQPLTIAETFCGLRVLPRADENATLRPREAMIRVDERLISLYGGKLTTWRATAEKVLNEIEIQLGAGESINTRMIDL